MPATAATVTVPVASLTLAADWRQRTVVPLDHDVVAQWADAKVAVGVGSIVPKAIPLSVAEAPPVKAAFSTPTAPELKTGAVDREGKQETSGEENN